jgi:RNase adaptor protein for sRNA GlmZ degradation
LITLESLIFRYLMPQPKVEELNKALKQHITKWTTTSQEYNKKILLLSLATATR